MVAFSNNRQQAGLTATSAGSWLLFFAGPRRYLAVLPSNVRPNLFAGD
jgi:hypothetical protein